MRVVYTSVVVVVGEPTSREKGGGDDITSTADSIHGYDIIFSGRPARKLYDEQTADN